jgi:hypothetical protein
MPWRGPEVPGEVPSLGLVVGQWIQDYCVVPDRELRGRPFILTEEQTIFLVWHYALTEEGKWRYPRGSQLMRPQKWGKGPLVAAICCAEAAGPTLFDGWDAKGEPVGRPWATPHIQVTAGSEDQTANTWRALQPMIEMGPLGDTMIPDTGLTRINLAGGGLVEPVTASARSRLGQRITFAVQDETHSWNRSNHGLQLADNQRRNLAGVGGRFVETTNAFDPVEQSVAQRTQSEPGVYIDDVDGGPGSVRNKAERRKVMRKAYGDSLVTRGGWVDLDRIDAEVEALLEHDPAQAERFFLNRKIAMEGAAFDIEQIKTLVRPQRLTSESVICLGVDGARHDDSLAVVGTDVKTGYQWLVAIEERPENAPEDYQHDFDRIDGAVSELIENDKLIVWRAYCDDQYISSLIESWQNRFGQKRFVTWHTNRQRQIAWAVRRYEEAIGSGEVHYDGNPILLRHLRHARKRMLTVLDDKERQMHTISKSSIKSPLKVDAAMAAVLSWEARSDALASGAISLTETPAMAEEKPPPVYRANYAPPITAPVGAWSGGMSDME